MLITYSEKWNLLWEMEPIFVASEIEPVTLGEGARDFRKNIKWPYAISVQRLS